MSERGGRLVVLDTNVVVSALLFRQGLASRFRRLWQAGSIAPLVSAATSRELLRVLTYPKFRLSAADREELLADFLPYSQVVRPEEHQDRIGRLPACRDPHDDMFLELGQAGRASELVTGDKDLLALNDPLMRRMGFLIITPADALASWGH